MAVDPRLLDSWCRRELGAAPSRQLFSRGHLAEVVAVELQDGRRVVLKLRPPAERIVAVVAVQRYLFDRGFPCPEPLVGPTHFDWRLGTAEAYVTAHTLGVPVPPVWQTAHLLAQLIGLTPPPQAFVALRSPPPWVGWDHAGQGTWPEPDDLDVDLNQLVGPSWLDDAGARVRGRLWKDRSSEVIGHADWEAHNIGWTGTEPVVVYDWDSLAIRSEPTLAGAAAAVFASTSGARVAATVEDTEAFLDGYQDRRGAWTPEAVEVAWAAGLWVLLYNAKKETAGGGTGYLKHLDAELDQRMMRAGL